MKLQTHIPPRADGTVIAEGANGKAFVFEPNEAGVLECDVTDKATAAQLLEHGLCFTPGKSAPPAAAPAPKTASDSKKPPVAKPLAQTKPDAGPDAEAAKE